MAEFSSLSESLLRAISRIKGVGDVSRIDGKPTAALVKLDQDVDVREQLAKAAVDSSSLMLSCEKQGASLEALFARAPGTGLSNKSHPVEESVKQREPFCLTSSWPRRYSTNSVP